MCPKPLCLNPDKVSPHLRAFSYASTSDAVTSWTQAHVVDILDVFGGEIRLSVYKRILSSVTRYVFSDWNESKPCLLDVKRY